MERFFVLMSLLLAVTNAHGEIIGSKRLALADQASLWDLHEVELRKVADEDTGAAISASNECGNRMIMNSLDNVSWEDIVNIGSQVWEIVKANKPVLHVETPVAHAMPKGLGCWSELEGWKAPRTQSYEVVYKNGFDIEAVVFRFRLQFTHGGGYRGVGQYLANATVLASQLDVIWGYTVNAKVDIARAVNLGSVKNPMAGLEMNLHWNVKTMLKESENSVHFFVTGEGQVNFAD